MVQADASGQERAVLVALLRWQGDEDPTLSMGVPTICKYTGLDEDTVKHRLSSLMKRRYVSKGGYEYPVLEYVSEAKGGHSASYRLGIPRRGPEDGSNILTRKERMEWGKTQRGRAIRMTGLSFQGQRMPIEFLDDVRVMHWTRGD